MLSGFKIKKLNLRFTLWYALLVFIAFGATVWFMLLSFYGNIISEKEEVAKQKAQIISNALNSQLSAVYSLYSMMLDNAGISDIMRYNDQNSDLSERQLFALSNYFAYYKDKGVPVRAIFAANIDGQIMDPLYRNEDFVYLTDDNSDFQKYLVDKKHTFFSPLNNFPYFQKHNARGDNITFFGEYYVKPSYEPIGYIAINIVANRFFAQAQKQSDQTFDYGFIRTPYQTNIPIGKNYISVESFPQDLYTPSESTQTKLRLGGENYLVYTLPLDEYPDWVFVGMINYQNLTSSVRRMTYFIVAIFFMAVLLVAVLSFYVAKKITNPLVAVNCAMQVMEKGEYPEPVECNTKDEIRALVDGFNSMVSSVEKLTTNLIQREQENKNIEVAMVQSQLDLLQSQINPHFIHNTLNTLKYMATKEGNTQLCNTITAFNSLLRASISSGSVFISIGEEIGYVKSYMNIQENRYEKRIDVTYCVDPEANFARVPKLILQPLVENALFHGLLPTKDGGRIDVVCLKQGDCLSVAVSDDGVGIPPDVLDRLMRGDLTNNRGYNSIGLLNVKERLELYYPNKANFHISSQQGYGTLIMFQIPFEQI